MTIVSILLGFVDPPTADPSQQLFGICGEYDYIIPRGVSTISAVCVGAGGSASEYR